MDNRKNFEKKGSKIAAYAKPEVILLITIVVAAWFGRNKIQNSPIGKSIGNNAILWAPILAGATGAVVNSAINTFKEEREVTRQRDSKEIAECQQYMSAAFDRASKFYTEHDYHAAYLYYKEARDHLIVLYSHDNSRFKKQLAQVNYRMSLAKYKLNLFDDAIQIIQPVIEEQIAKDDHLYVRALNLIGMCYLKKGEDEKAIECFKTSLKLDQNQSAEIMVYNYLTKQYDLALIHSPIISLNAEVSHPIREDSILNDYTDLFKISAECYEKQTPPNYERAVSLYEAALTTLTKITSNAEEQIAMLRSCGDAYLHLSERKHAQDSIVIIEGLSEVNHSTRKLNKNELIIEARNKWLLGLKIIRELKHLPIDKRPTYLEAQEAHFKNKLQGTSSVVGAPSTLYSESSSTTISQINASSSSYTTNSNLRHKSN